MASIVFQQCFSLLCFSILFSFVQCKFEVELVQVIFRHGDRTPGKGELFPNDQHKNASVYKQYGYKQLTNKGKLREYRIGQMLRERYDDYLGKYHPQDVYAYSSNTDRTKMSLLLVLAGLYPITNESSWTDNMNWSPIPINHVPKSLDIVNLPHHCSQYLQELNNLTQYSYISQKMSDFGPLYSFLQNKTGYSHVDVDQAYSVFNTIVAYDSMNLSRPEWLTNDVFARLLDFAAFNYERMSYTINMQRMFGGVIIRRFLENMNKTRKIYLYSTHDTNMAAILKSHKFTFPRLPEYGATFILENLRDENNNKYIQILTWDAISEKLNHMKLDDCDYICSLNDYMRIVNPILPSNDETRCLIDKLNGSDLESSLSND